MMIRMACAAWMAVAAAIASAQPAAPTPQQAAAMLRDGKFDRRSPVVVAVDRVKDAVVNVSSTRLVKVRFGLFDDEAFDRAFGGADPFSRTVQTTSLGSGVIIHPAGLVLTNAHVIARASEVTCSLNDKEKFTARVIAADLKHDLAVLKLDARRPLPFVPMGRSDDLMIGETVIAIGNAMGYAHTVTTGVVSAVERQIKLSDEMALDHLVQTDASINPGNSGGPLLNINGELIGVNTAIRGDAQNIGFAIPIDAARAELAHLLDFARVNEVVFGATLADKPDPTVTAVVAKSPADEAGLNVGDVVAAVDGKPVASLLDFNASLLHKSAGYTVRLEVRRRTGGKTETRELSVQLAAAPKPDGEALLWQRFGLKVRVIDAETARQYRIREGAGLLVTQMGADSPAARAIQPGDVLVQVGEQAVNSVDDLGAALKRVSSGDAVMLRVVRGRLVVGTTLRAR